MGFIVKVTKEERCRESRVVGLGGVSFVHALGFASGGGGNGPEQGYSGGVDWLDWLDWLDWFSEDSRWFDAGFSGQARLQGYDFDKY